jgi:hypothetical protein
MDLNPSEQFGIASRSLPYVIPLSIMLLVFFGWNAWHYRLEQERRAHAKAAERASIAAAKLASEEATRTEFKRRARNARSERRVEQLYDEINQLTRLSERVLLPDRVDRTTPATTSDREATSSRP